MPDVEPLAPELVYERRESSSVVRGATRPILRLRRDGSRGHVDLVLLDGDRFVDVSFHPAAAAALVAGHARRAGRDPNGWLGALAAAVLDDAERWGTWSPPPTSPCRTHLVALLGGLAHPVLGLAYEAGTAPVGEVPRWASAALATTAVVDAAGELFGRRRATRPVVRSLADFLRRPRLAWWQLALVVGARESLEADEVASLLAIEPGEEGADAAERLPEPDDLLTIGAAVAAAPAGWSRRMLGGALPGAGGARRAARALRLLLDVAADLRGPLPAHLDDLEAACLRAASIDPTPRATPAPAVAATAAPVAPAPPPAPASVRAPAEWTRPRGAPVVAGRPPAADLVFRHPALVRELQGVALGELQLVVPRTPAELRAWGRLLGNCLGDFGPAVASGRTTVVGVRQGGLFVAALELRLHDRTLVQFLGAHNRVPPAAVVRPVVAELARRALVAAPVPAR